MKAILFVIQNDADHAQAKGLIDKLMGSDDPADQARMSAQARLIEAYERTRWPRRAPRRRNRSARGWGRWLALPLVSASPRWLPTSASAKNSPRC